MRYPIEWYVKMHSMLKDEKGQTMVEYALLIALIAIVLAGVAIPALSTNIGKTFDNIGTVLTK